MANCSTFDADFTVEHNFTKTLRERLLHAVSDANAKGRPESEAILRLLRKHPRAVSALADTKHNHRITLRSIELMLRAHCSPEEIYKKLLRLMSVYEANVCFRIPDRDFKQAIYCNEIAQLLADLKAIEGVLADNSALPSASREAVIGEILAQVVPRECLVKLVLLPRQYFRNELEKAHVLEDLLKPKGVTCAR